MTGMQFTGERYVPNLDWPEISYEHWHRYLYASQFVAGQTVLDVASGEGYGSALLAETAERVVGVDISAETVRFARDKYARPNLEFLCGPADAIPVEGEAIFDWVVSFETIEHLDEEEQSRFMSEVNRLLKPNGVLILSTPNKLFYSDRRSYKNEFHSREFYEQEYVDFLSAFFSTVHIVGQRVYPVSYMWHPAGLDKPVTEHQIAYTQGYFGPLGEDQKELYYMIGVCSNAPIPAPANSLLLDISERASRVRRDQLAQKEQVLKELQTSLEAQTEAAERAGEEIARLEGVVMEMRNQLAAAIYRQRRLTQQREALEQEISEQMAHLDALADLADQIQLNDSDLAAVLRERDYLVNQQLVRRVRFAVSVTLPPGARIVVVSKGDEDLVKLDGHQAWHFPQEDDGVYAGHYPGDGSSAIAQLEALRARGADYLLIPSTAFWWLEHYHDFKRHLEGHYPLVLKEDQTCLLFALHPSAVNEIRGSTAHVDVSKLNGSVSGKQ